MTPAARSLTALAMACAAITPLAAQAANKPVAGERASEMRHVAWSRSANIYEGLR
jgi:hypothetical protein